MKNLENSTVLLSLIESLREHNSWCGETHIQKTAYFLKKLLNVPLDFDFILYKHGSFSFDLSNELSSMISDSFIKLIPQNPYGPSLEKGDRSELLIKHFPEAYKKYDKQIKFISGKLGQKKVFELERVATALYVTKEEDIEGTVDARAGRLNQLKKHIKMSDAKKAVKEVDEIIKDVEAMRT